MENLNQNWIFKKRQGTPPILALFEHMSVGMNMHQYL